MYLNNSAQFGIKSSTQATRLQLIGKNTSLVEKYHSALLPHPAVQLLDYFSAKDITDSSTVVTASVFKSDCPGRVGYLLGSTTATAYRGDVQFRDLAAICFPGGNMTLKYTGKRKHLTQYGLGITLK